MDSSNKTVTDWNNCLLVCTYKSEKTELLSIMKSYLKSKKFMVWMKRIPTIIPTKTGNLSQMITFYFIKKNLEKRLKN